MCRCVAKAATLMLPLMVLQACATDTEPSTSLRPAITINPCPVSGETVRWLAVQDGSGPWTVIAADQGSFVFTIKSDRAGVARYFETSSGQGSGSAINVTYATAAELASILPVCPSSVGAASGALKPITLSVAGLQGTDQASVSYGAGAVSFSKNGSAVRNVPDGPLDLIAAIYKNDIATSEYYASSLIVRRDATPAANALVPTFDMSGTETTTPVQHTVLVTNSDGPGPVNVMTTLYTAHNATLLSASAGPAGSLSRAWFVTLPATMVMGTEFQQLNVDDSYHQVDGEYDTRRLSVRATSISDTSLDLGPHVVMSISAPRDGNRLRVSAAYQIQPEYNGYWTFSTGQPARTVAVTMSRAYVGGASQITLMVPDLTTLDGYNPLWSLITYEVTSWQLMATSDDILSLASPPRSGPSRSGISGASGIFTEQGAVLR